MVNDNLIVPIAVDSLLPHKTPMLMVDRILSIDDESQSSIIETIVRPEFPFIDCDNSLLSEAMIEIMAQAAAAQHGFNLRRDGKKEEKGFIVGIRKFELLGRASVGDRLEVTVRLGPEIESLSVVYGQVYFADNLIAAAELTVWHGA